MQRSPLVENTTLRRPSLYLVLRIREFPRIPLKVNLSDHILELLRAALEIKLFFELVPLLTQKAARQKTVGTKNCYDNRSLIILRRRQRCPCSSNNQKSPSGNANTAAAQSNKETRAADPSPDCSFLAFTEHVAHSSPFISFRFNPPLTPVPPKLDYAALSRKHFSSGIGS